VILLRGKNSLEKSGTLELARTDGTELSQYFAHCLVELCVVAGRSSALDAVVESTCRSADFLFELGVGRGQTGQVVLQCVVTRAHRILTRSGKRASFYQRLLRQRMNQVLLSSTGQSQQTEQHETGDR